MENGGRMKMERITLGGFAGSGKSTVAKIICDKLNYEFISVGNFTRDYAKKEFGVSINEFQEMCKQNPELDRDIDRKFQALCNSTKRIVVDYRLGFRFVEDAFCVLLKVTDEVAFQRLQNAERGMEKTDAVSIKERNENMRARFIEQYNVDFSDERNYDLVVNTDLISSEQVADMIIDSFQRSLSLK